MMLRFFVLLPLILVGCSWFSSPPKDEGAQLGLACEVAKCECRAQHTVLSFSKAPPPAPIEWRTDGSASCPVGYVLTRTD
jgi:hypothetical protein